VRCLIVDDNDEFLRVALELKPDVALVDIRLGEESGCDVARQIAGRAGAGLPRVILISACREDDFAVMIADSPAVSFLPKSALSGAAIRSILADVQSEGAP
jgi:DNA-binding response OmpR family regulator